MLFYFVAAVCRTLCLARGPTSPVTSAWPSSTVHTAAAGERVCWARCSAVSLCVKSLITQMLSAKWRKKVCKSCITQNQTHVNSNETDFLIAWYYISPHIFLFRFWNHRPPALKSEEQRRRGRTAEVLCGHQQPASASQVPASLLSEETPVQVRVPCGCMM